MCFFEIVIASVAKQSIRGKYGGYGLLRRFAPRNGDYPLLDKGSKSFSKRFRQGGAAIILGLLFSVVSIPSGMAGHTDLPGFRFEKKTESSHLDFVEDVGVPGVAVKVAFSPSIHQVSARPCFSSRENDVCLRSLPSQISWIGIKRLVVSDLGPNGFQETGSFPVVFDIEREADMLIVDLPNIGGLTKNPSALDDGYVFSGNAGRVGRSLCHGPKQDCRDAQDDSESGNQRVLIGFQENVYGMERDPNYPWDDPAKRGAVILITALSGCALAYFLARRK
jgi:hypothetical protein